MHLSHLEKSCILPASELGQLSQIIRLFACYAHMIHMCCCEKNHTGLAFTTLRPPRAVLPTTTDSFLGFDYAAVSGTVRVTCPSPLHENLLVEIALVLLYKHTPVNPSLFDTHNSYDMDNINDAILLQEKDGITYFPVSSDTPTPHSPRPQHW